MRLSSSRILIVFSRQFHNICFIVKIFLVTSLHSLGTADYYCVNVSAATAMQ